MYNIIIEKDKPLRDLNTFHLNVTADHFVVLHNKDQILSFVREMLSKYSKMMVLGGGSNILFTENFHGLIVKLKLMGINVLQETDDFVKVKVGCGESWDHFVEYCTLKGWGGIENLVAIPGEVGAAPVQNIGAYGREVKDVIESVETIDLHTKEIRLLTKQECQFSYRDSIFKSKYKGRFWIIGVNFLLQKKKEFFTDYGALKSLLPENNDEWSFKSIADTIRNIRNSKLPKVEEIGSAGSFFKNPSIEEAHFWALKKRFPQMPFYPQDDLYKIPAGWLIEKCGWKGYRNNDVGIYPEQALILVNYGNGTGKEIYNLAQLIQRNVKKHFDISLQPEVTIV